MHRSLGEEQAGSSNLADEAHEEPRLLEGVAVGLEDLPVGLDAVDEQRLMVEQTKVADEGAVGVLIRPF